MYDPRKCDLELLTEWFHLLFRKKQATSSGHGYAIISEVTRGNIA